MTPPPPENGGSNSKKQDTGSPVLKKPGLYMRIPKICLTPVYIKSQHFYADCGHCLACRIKKKSEWQKRCEMEWGFNNWKGIFCTLTYAPKYLPKDGLQKRHLQLFFKRLRRRMHRRKMDKFKYFACGEYGTQGTKRAHYHFVLFGHRVGKLRELMYQCWGMCNRASFKCESIRTNKAAAYCAGYAISKIGRAYARNYRLKTGNNAPFQLQSQGIGLSSLLKLTETTDILETKTFPGPHGQRFIPCRYFRQKLGFTHADYEHLLRHKQENYDNIIKHKNTKNLTLWYDVGKKIAHRIYAPAYHTLDKDYREYINLALTAESAGWRKKL